MVFCYKWHKTTFQVICPLISTFSKSHSANHNFLISNRGISEFYMDTLRDQKFLLVFQINPRPRWPGFCHRARGITTSWTDRELHLPIIFCSKNIRNMSRWLLMIQFLRNMVKNYQALAGTGPIQTTQLSGASPWLPAIWWLGTVIFHFLWICITKTQDNQKLIWQSARSTNHLCSSWILMTSWELLRVDNFRRNFSTQISCFLTWWSTSNIMSQCSTLWISCCLALGIMNRLLE